MNVIVIGGGVAGAASAIALRRLGLDVTVYEAYAEPAGRVGSFLSLAGNGLRVLRSLGVLEQVQRAASPCHASACGRVRASCWPTSHAVGSATTTCTA